METLVDITLFIVKATYLIREETYLRGGASAQCGRVLTEIIAPVAWGGLRRAHQAVQVIEAPISRQLFQGRQGAVEVNIIINLSEVIDWNKWRLCLIDDIQEKL